MPKDESIDKVLQERGSRYGSFIGHSLITQALKDVMKGNATATNPETNLKQNINTNWDRLSPSQKEALEMVAHKIGRILNGDPDYDDSWVDIAGYSKLVADELQGKIQ